MDHRNLPIYVVGMRMKGVDRFRMIRPRATKVSPRERAETKRFKERWEYKKRRWNIEVGMPTPDRKSYPGSWWPVIEEALKYRTW